MFPLASDFSCFPPRAKHYVLDVASELSREKHDKERIISVAAKRRRRYSTETVGETKTKPSGNDSVAIAGLLPWLTKRR